ncbi:hypothetical protein DYB25_011357 [Aphanomyces astaci]|uniref:Uncharacterized protein n=1 Tax=Aphanomyces astaci TaxID=112090 RepID=A0A397A7Q1_APHAT|nr:hypothetical protein DYB25_011357 [Aphanomyces astaci]RHY37671.1 hypothetical protein DYB38_011669 [Aphanomyces astaci]RHY46399.1 hypothetical protein DYB30_012098 [Aphanomyces astaci]RHY72964.1 hypothetical protein DYB34_013288 [Aphanomyces astaci]RHZ08811.1 hypothetical protein DYB26_003402 [Aphanomyces astaci]
MRGGSTASTRTIQLEISICLGCYVETRIKTTTQRRRFLVPCALSYVELPVIRDIRYNLNAVSDAKALLDFRFDDMEFKELGFLLGLPAVGLPNATVLPGTKLSPQRNSDATPILRRDMTTPNRDLHLTNIGNPAQALLTSAANLNMEIDHLTRQTPAGDGQEDLQQQRTEMETELVRLREENAHQRTQLAVYHRVHNENKTSHELLESRVQELLTKWSDNRANRDQQLRIRAVHRFWNWLDKTCALVNSKSVAVLCETYGVLSREGRVPTTVMQRLRAAHGIHITTGAPTAPQTNDIVKIPPFTAKASAPPSGNEFKRIPKNPRTSLSQLPPVQSVPGEMLDVCEEVRVTKPWERYRRAGSILLDQDGPEGQHQPQFHNSVATFWGRYGQQLWEQTYAPFGNANHLDPLFHQVFNLHVKLQRLINNTDYDDTLVHFLCFTHQAWSV